MSGGVEISVSANSARELARLSKKIKDAGNRDVKLLMARNLRAATEPAKRAIRESALANLPSAGGLAARVAASKITTKTTTAGKRVGIRIQVAGNMDIQSVNGRGRIRKPLFGNKDYWYDQAVEPGFVDKPCEELAPTTRAAINAVMQEIEHKLT